MNIPTQKWQLLAQFADCEMATAKQLFRSLDELRIDAKLVAVNELMQYEVQALFPTKSIEPTAIIVVSDKHVEAHQYMMRFLKIDDS